MATGAGQTVLVLGGGIGGVAAANRLRRRLDRRHRVVLVNRDPDFTFAASYLWVMSGHRRAGQVTRPLNKLRRRGIDPQVRRATSTANYRRRTPGQRPSALAEFAPLLPTLIGS